MRLKKHWAFALSVLASVQMLACVHSGVITQPVQVAIGVTPASATCTITPAGSGPIPGIADPAAPGSGHLLFQIPRADVGQTYTVTCSADGYLQSVAMRTAGLPALNAEFDHVTLALAHVDPASWSMAQLLNIRGAMWTARLNLPYGPRPGQDDNILAMDFYQFFAAPDRARMLDAYRARGYTHAVTGPLVGTDCYHSQFPCHDAGQPGMLPTDGVPTQAQFDFYLDRMQEWWDAGIAPIHFAHPDGWTLEQEQQLDALYSQPRAQKLLRIVVYTGWEPTKYDWTSAQWVAFFQHAAQLFPNAARLVHTVCDVDAPTGGNDDQTLAGGNATAWANAVPYLHGWLVQNCGYIDGAGETPDPTFLKNFTDQFDQTQGRASLTSRFRLGVGGWPTNSANGGPLKVYAAEFASYSDYWKNWSEEQARLLGDAAMKSGADGVLDGVH